MLKGGYKIFKVCEEWHPGMMGSNVRGNVSSPNIQWQNGSPFSRQFSQGYSESSWTCAPSWAFLAFVPGCKVAVAK